MEAGNSWRRLAGRFAGRFAGATTLTVAAALAATWIDPSAPLGEMTPWLAAGILALAAATAFGARPERTLARFGSLGLAGATFFLGLLAWVTSNGKGAPAPRVYLLGLLALAAAIFLHRLPGWRGSFRRLLALGAALGWAPLTALQANGGGSWDGLPFFAGCSVAASVALILCSLGVFFLQPPPWLLGIALGGQRTAVQARLLIAAMLLLPLLVGAAARGLIRLGWMDPVPADALHDAVMVLGLLAIGFLGAGLFRRESHAARRAAAAGKAALAEAEAFFEGTPSGMLVMDLEGRIQRANAQACYILACPAEHLRNRLLTEFIPGLAAEFPSLGPQVHFTASTGLLATRSDGSQIPVDVALNPLTTGHSHLVLGSLRDLSKAHAAQRRLTERQHRLEEAQALAQTGSWDWAGSGNVAYSPEFLRIVGRKRESIPRATGLERSFFPAESWERLEAAFAASRASGNDFQLDLEVERPDGSKREVIARGGPRERDGVSRLPGTLQDVTEQRRIERALVGANERLELANDAAGVGIWDVDVRTRTVVTDAQHDRLFGLEPGAFGTSALAWRDWIHPDDLERVLSHVAAALRGEVEYDLEFRIRLPTGGIRHLRARGAVRRNAADEALRLVGVYWDVTEQAEARKVIETALAEKEVLLREIHHRVKNNMQLVSSLLELHASRLVGPEEAAIFRDCQKRIRSMARIHERLYGAKDLAVIDFGDHLRELVSLQAQSAERLDCRVQLEFRCVSLPLALDLAIPLGLVAAELVGNVWLHAFAGRSTGQVRVRLDRSSAEQAVLELEDDGPGFPTDFDPGHAPSLGWRLIHALCRQIRARSEIRRLPGGTIVRVEFPLTAPTA